MPSPRVLLVAEQLRRRVPGGIGTYVRGLASGLDALDEGRPAWPERNGGPRPEGRPARPERNGRPRPELILWASRRPQGAPDPLADVGRVVSSPLPSRALVWLWDRSETAVRVVKAAAPPVEAEVVHAPSLAVPHAGSLPLAVTVHDLAWRRVPHTFPPRGRKWHEAALGRALARASAFVAPSRQTADDLVAAGADARRVEVVEEGCDHLPPPDHEAAAALLPPDARDGYVLTVSTLEPRKNLHRLVAAYESALPRLAGRWPLVVVGPTGWGPALRPRPGVILAGHVPDTVLAGLYAGARLVATVPLVEGFGLSAVEAMAAGVPVMASPQPSTGTGGAALEVDPLDVEAIATALVRVDTDDALRADLVAAGTERARMLTWAAAAAGHVDVWEGLL